jgi:hypothetical protein
MVAVLRVLEGTVGGLLVLIVLVDVFSGVVVPRQTARSTPISRSIMRPGWRMWRWVGNRASDPVKREAMLGVFAPLVLVVILAVWIVFEVVGFGILVHSLRGGFTRSPGILGSLYVAGSSLFGLGQSAYVPMAPAARLVGPVINVTGLGTIALVITFLFSLYGNFQRREALVVTLDARAGAPPSGVTILETHAQYYMLDRLPQLFMDWELWAAEVLDSHLAYPILTLFRSSHDNESWISAVGAVLDATTLTISTIEGVPVGPAKMMHAMGTHLVEDLAYRFRLHDDHDVLVEREEFDDARRRLAAAGLALREEESSWERFSRMRADYASRLNQMANLWATPPAQWIGDRSTIRHIHPRRSVSPVESPAEAGPAQERPASP